MKIRDTDVNKKKKTTKCPDCGGTKIDQMDPTMYCPFCNGKGRVNVKDLRGTIFE